MRGLGVLVGVAPYKCYNIVSANPIFPPPWAVGVLVDAAPYNLQYCLCKPNTPPALPVGVLVGVVPYKSDSIIKLVLR